MKDKELLSELMEYLQYIGHYGHFIGHLHSEKGYSIEEVEEAWDELEAPRFEQ